MSNRDHDYRLLVEFTAEQRDHLDQQRARKIPASVYIRSLIDADMERSRFKEGGSPRNTPPAWGRPTVFNDARPAQTSDTPPSATKPGNSGEAGVLNEDHRYPGDQGKGGGW